MARFAGVTSDMIANLMELIMLFGSFLYFYVVGNIVIIRNLEMDTLFVHKLASEWLSSLRNFHMYVLHTNSDTLTLELIK